MIANIVTNTHSRLKTIPWSEDISNKKYVLSNSEFVQCNFFIFDYVTFIQFKICCCVQNFIEIGWFFAEIWRYIDFQNGGRPPSWNYFITIRDHPRRLLLAAAACQISCQSDTQIYRLNFSYIWLEMPIQAPKMGFFCVLWTPLNVITHHIETPKGISLRKSASFKLSTVKIRWGVWPVGELTESVTDTHRDTQVNLYSVHV